MKGLERNPGRKKKKKQHKIIKKPFCQTYERKAFSLHIKFSNWYQRSTSTHEKKK